MSKIVYNKLYESEGMLMEKRNVMKNNLVRMVVIVLISVVIFSTPVQAAKLNKSSLTLTKGKTYTLKMKGSKKKVTWKVKGKKIVKLSNKKKSSVKIKAVKAGKTTVTAKIGKKTYKCKVIVVNPVTKKKNTTTTDATTEQTTSTTTEEQVQEKKKVWIITKWAETVYTPVYVNKRTQFECTGCGFKTDDGEEFDEHEYNHMLNEEPAGYRLNTIWDSMYYVTTEYPEEGYWIELDEYPENVKWRTDSSYPDGGYYYIDKSSN